MMGSEHSLFHIIYMHPHLMVAYPEIQLQEELRSMQLVHKIIDYEN
jgi:hypothetical protein